MNVNATSAPNFVTGPVYDSGALPIVEDEEDQTSVTPPPTANSLSGIEKQFAALIKNLTTQLSALEDQLMKALRQLITGAAKREDGDDKPAPPVKGHPPLHPYGKIINSAANRYEVDPLLVSAVIRQESGFKPDAVSNAGAMGLMQLMPDTARSLGIRDAFDPRENVEGGTAILRQLLDRYHGQLDLALAAYNAGPDAVDKYGGIPPFPETQAYVRSVLSSYKTGALAATPA